MTDLHMGFLRSGGNLVNIVSKLSYRAWSYF